MKRFFKLNIFEIGIILGLIANFRDTPLRIIAILVWILIPIVFYFRSKKIHYNYYINFIIISIFTLLLFIPLTVNISDLSINLSGPAVELFTPFLAPFGILYLNQKTQNNFKTEKIIKILILLLIIEALHRYVLAPDLFLNYFNRQAAKTIGWFSTTNVNGQILATLFFVIWLKKDLNKRKLYLFITILLLITAMARAALVAVLLTLLVSFFIRKKLNFIPLIFGFIILSFFYLDPFDLAQDGSFLSKIEFITTTLTILETSSIKDIFFGYGLSYETIIATLGVNSWSPHIPFLKAYMYFGLFGLSFYLAHILQLLYLSDKNFIEPLLSFIILGFAGAPIFWPGLLSISILSNSSINIQMKNFKKITNEEI